MHGRSSIIGGTCPGCPYAYAYDMTCFGWIGAVHKLVLRKLTSSSIFSLAQWRRPGAEFGGDGKFFRGPRFLNDVFRRKILIFTAKISYDFFSHRPCFLDFPFLFPDCPYLYCVKCRLLPFLTRQTTILQKNSSMTPF